MMQRMLTAGREAIWVLLTASVLAAMVYILQPDRLRKDAGSTDSASGLQDNLLSLEAAADYHRRGAAVFADARSDFDFQAGHIDGALNLDPALFDTWAETVFSKIAAESVIITYCDGERCTLSLDLVEKLIWLGYEKVYHLKNGWSLWKEKGLPTAAGPQ